MPIYEYQCKKCGQFEVTQKITERPLTRCPTCQNKVTKLISNTSFQLKGSGWYVTDYARSGSGGKDDAKKEGAGDSAAKSEGGSGTKSEAKPETKSETKAKSETKTKSETKAAETGTGNS